MDRNKHLHSGDQHAHIFDRKGNKLYAVTQSGQPSHGSKSFRLSDEQADALRQQHFIIPDDNVVEATLVGSGKVELLAG